MAGYALTVDPATLMLRPREDFVERLPEAHGPVADGDLGRHLEAAGLDVDQELPPALRALAQADLEADQLLPAFRRGSEDDQHALGLGLHPGLQVDAVRPDADIPAGREIAALPAVVLGLPILLEPANHRRRQVRRVLPQYGGQRSAHSLEPVALEGLTLKVARRDAAEVKHRQQGIEALRPSRPAWQDLRAEADLPLGRHLRGAVAHLRAAHVERADPGLDAALRPVMSDNQVGRHHQPIWPVAPAGGRA